MILSAGQVYFRDIQNFLPYVLRIWLYITPILYYGNEVKGNLRIVLDANPIGLLFNSWSEAVNKGHTPSPLSFAVGGGWALLAIVVGTLFFMSRERDFAVRV